MKLFARQHGAGDYRLARIGIAELLEPLGDFVEYEIGFRPRRHGTFRLAPLLAALRTDEALREEFLLFVRARGGGLTLTIDRLKTIWWPSRKSMYPGFFVLALVEFGLLHGLFAAEKKPRAGRR